MAAAAGTVIGVAEIFGGGVAPSVSGFLAQNYGIEYVLYLALGGLLLCVTATSFLTETAPTRAVSPGVDGVGVSAGL